MKNIALIIALFFSMQLVAQYGNQLPPVTNADTNKYLQYRPTGWTMGSGSSGISGSGVANQVAFWDGTSTVTGEADLTWNPSTNVLSIQGAAPIIEAYRASSGAAYMRLRNTFNTWDWYINGSDLGLEPQVANANFTVRNLANTTQFQITTHATNTNCRFDVIGRGNFGLAIGSAAKGFVNIAANTTLIPTLSFDTSGALVSTPQAGYMEAVGGNLYYSNKTGRKTIAYTDGSNSAFILNGGNTGTVTIGTNDPNPLNFQTNGTRRMSIPSSGIALDNTSSKILALSSTDSLVYVQRSATLSWMHTATLATALTLPSESIEGVVIPAEYNGWQIVEVLYRTQSAVSIANLDVQIVRQTSAGSSSGTLAGNITTTNRHASVTGNFTVNTGDLITSSAIAGTAVADGLTVTIILKKP